MRSAHLTFASPRPATQHDSRRALALSAVVATALFLAAAGASNSAPAFGTHAPLRQGEAQSAGADALRLAPQYRHATTPFHRLPPPLPQPDARNGAVFASEFAGVSGDNGFLESANITKPAGGALSPFFFGVVGPEGMAFAGGTLLVADASQSKVLMVRSAQIVGALDDAGQLPSDVALTRNGTTFVANIFNASFGPGSVSIYPNGSLTPAASLTAKSFFQVIGVAVDRAGDVFVANNRRRFKDGQIVAFPNGSAHGMVLRNIALGIAGGVKIDPETQDLLVVDQATRLVSVYAAPYTGSPKATYPVPNGGAAVDVALDANSSHLYFADDMFGTVDVISYPVGKFLGSYTGGIQPIGIAISPSSR